MSLAFDGKKQWLYKKYQYDLEHISANPRANINQHNSTELA